eukprot:2019839-Ditylum_brightwellii.AAC.1
MLKADDTTAVAYASIGREVPIAINQAFHDTHLSGDASETMEENVGMLAGLASAVHFDMLTLCNCFWLVWEEYCSKADTRIQKEQQHNALIANPL